MHAVLCYYCSCSQLLLLQNLAKCSYSTHMTLLGKPSEGMWNHPSPHSPLGTRTNCQCHFISVCMALWLHLEEIFLGLGLNVTEININSTETRSIYIYICKQGMRKSEGKYTKHQFSTLECNCNVKGCRDRALYIYLHFSSSTEEKY